ncbi:YceI family protein [Fluviispira multicolorata]|uniref:Polyisoprenoid-binding protein n=1 Tax=Fluviispira multicolorata TaxID=2654512 RepID=A0A833N127_9BACT|nr:YceI family protein [Fluviispira multicolorata]KAB8029850.1 polyisoprenoid-binding protein [Fluviispira multicolorata]
MRNLILKMNLYILFSIIILVSFNVFSLQPGKYQLDQKESKVEFSVQNFVFMTVNGQFDKFQGKLQITKKFTDSKVEATVETKSINTDNSSRDKHLRSGDFFEVEKYPKMIFIGKSFTGDLNSFKIIGDLTIKGITKSIVFEGKSMSPKNADKELFNIDTKVNRNDFNLSHGSFIGETVTIKLNLMPVKN